MENNPYQTPSANLFGSSSTTTAEAVPGEAIVMLQRTKPWLRFFGVLMWIAVAFMLFGAAAMLAMGIGGAAMAAGSNSPIGAAEGGIMIGLAALYVVMAFFYIYPAIKIWKAGTAIKKLMASRQPEDLVAALDHQRAFWKFVGIMTIIMIILYIGIFVVMGVVGVAGAMGGMKALEGVTPPGQ
ncbi:MAG TPA: hypothetical protein DIT64_02595 [Verrucomicrobiales bacterium]|nr:hypothetical protein [Verrucomicrobiales bacterium]